MTRPRGLFVGLATLDVMHHVAQPPAPNEKLTAAATHLAAGGPAANAAVTFAALGGDATLVTALGRTPVAALIRADLELAGVTVVDAAPTSDQLPPVSAITVTTATGERSVVGSDAVVSAAEPPPGLAALVTAADVLLVDGHHPALALAAARLASATHTPTPVIVDLGRWKPVMDDLLPHATAMVCSADARTPGARDSLATAATLRLRGVPDVVITRGPDPVLWWTRVGDGEIAVSPVVAVDTLGAGDAFHGAYALAVAQGADVPTAIRTAIATASLRVQHAGPRAWLAHLRPHAHDGEPHLPPSARPGAAHPAEPTEP